MTNTILLNTWIDKSGFKKTYIAQRLGLSFQGFLNKLNGKSEFTVREVIILCRLLKIPFDDREVIFFTLDVDE